MHWINFPLLMIMIWSGLRIYWAEDVYRIGIADWTLVAFFPDGFNERLDLDRHLARGMAFHFTFAWLFTINGILYEVDMRLRPSGRAGPVAVSLEAFQHYQAEEAWTWEHMALTRLRFICGDEELGERVQQIAANAICDRARSPRRKQIPSDVSDMRQTLYREKPGHGLWDLKSARGGLIDIEFMAQQEMLLRARTDLVRANTAQALSGLADADGEASEDWCFLRAALNLLSAMQQLQRLALGSGPQERPLPEGLKKRFCRAAGEEEFEGLEDRLTAVKARVHELACEKLHLLATES